LVKESCGAENASDLPTKTGIEDRPCNVRRSQDNLRSEKPVLLSTEEVESLVPTLSIQESERIVGLTRERVEGALSAEPAYPAKALRFAVFSYLLELTRIVPFELRRQDHRVRGVESQLKAQVAGKAREMAVDIQRLHGRGLNARLPYQRPN
jgi:hypothetical protein